jgi:vacuolar protein sorting-associated protein 72
MASSPAGSPRRRTLNAEDEAAAQSDTHESESSNDGSGEEGSDDEPTELMVTTRQKRSTAGNRLQTLLQQAADEDDELAGLFAEDEDDVGFEDVEDDASDVQMDSSSDDEDQGPQAGADEELEGEKELRRDARAELKKKRKPNDHLPKAFLKRVKIDTTAEKTVAAPRPKKKSERASWLPTPEEAPTRTSSRDTTRRRKQELQVQIAEREERRLRQLAVMEEAARRREAEKPKKELTQEDRLAEAARVEKLNAKSLNSWEEAEKAREEERMAKLEALKNRKLQGPFITWWSGMAEWAGGALKKVGKNLEVDVPAPRVRAPYGSKKKEKEEKGSKATNTPEPGSASTPRQGTPSVSFTQTAQTMQTNASFSTSQTATVDTAVLNASSLARRQSMSVDRASSTTMRADSPPAPQPSRTVLPESDPQRHFPESRTATLSPSVSTATLSGGSHPPYYPAPHQLHIQGSRSTTATLTPAPLQLPVRETPASTATLTPSPAPTATPIRMIPSQTTPFAFAPVSTPLIQEVPLTTQPATSSTSTPHLAAATPQPPITEPASSASAQCPTSLTPSVATDPAPSLSKSTFSLAVPNSAPVAPAANASAAATPTPEVAPAPAPPPEIYKGTYNALILTNFSAESLRSRETQARILFSSPSHIPPPGSFTPAPTTKSKKAQGPSQTMCAVTGYPARFRDPETGLGYCNSYAHKEIRRLARGEYAWSSMLGSYVGRGQAGARGVPERFLSKDGKGAESDAPVVGSAKEVV